MVAVRLDTDEVVRRYRFCSWWNAAGGCFLLVGMAVAFVVYPVVHTLSILMASGEADIHPTDVAMLLLGLVVLMVVLHLFRGAYPYEICISEDGTVILKRLLSWTRIKAHDISAIRWTTRSTGLPDGGSKDYRVVLIEHSRGRIELVGFDDAYDFAKNLQRLNPSIQVNAGL